MRYRPALPCRSKAAFLALALLATPAGAGSRGAPQDGVRLNLSIELSEDAETAAALDRSLSRFLAAAQAGVFPKELVEPADLRRFSFYFEALGRLGLRGEAQNDPPRVLKSYTLDGSRYRITVAFGGRRDGAPFLFKIVELEAVPHGSGYRFTCPLDARTAHFQKTQVGSITYRHSGPLDMEKAQAFAAFRDEFSALTKTQPGPLTYDCFQSLDELLLSHGLLFDATKCNFLGYDLGFMEDGGRRFVTGSGRPDYRFEYVGEHLEHESPNAQDLYWPFVNGMSAYYGGYALSGDDLATLKRQFRDRLAAEPETDFLAEFRNGRKSSVQRHFSHYVMSAFLCEEAIAKRGFDCALRLAHAGADGVRFFPLLESELGIDESNFHATIARLIAEG